MKYIFKAALALACITLVSTSCSRGDVHKMRTITVSGTGKVYVTPDKATVDLTVITRDDDIKAAQKENAGTMKDVQAALLGIGILPEDIQTYDYGISQDSYWKDSEREFGKYNVSNRIRVTMPDVEQASNVIDVAIKNGATGVERLSLSYKDEAAAVKKARTLAIENARAIAEESCGAAGTRLGKVLVMEELSSGARSPYMVQAASNSISQTWDGEAPVYYDSGDASDATPISSGKKEIRVVMSIVYELR